MFVGSKYTNKMDKDNIPLSENRIKRMLFHLLTLFLYDFFV